MNNFKYVTGALLAVAIFSWAMPLNAKTRDVNINTFKPSVHGADILGVLTSNMPEHLNWGVGAFLTYSHKPLTSEALNRVEVSNLFVTDFYGYLALWDRLSIGLDLPMAVVKGQGTDFVFGDIRLGLKARVIGGNGRGFGFSVAQDLTFPSASKNVLVGDELVSGTTSLIGDWSGHGWNVAINFGLRFKKPVDLFGHNTSHQMLLAAGLSAPLICGKLEAIGTMQVRTSLTKPFKSKYDNGLDLLGGLRGLAGPVGLTLVAGGGTLRGFGSPAFQITAGVEYSPKPCEKGCYVPPPDRDGDGIPDDEDECPDDPGLKEFNGCPDRDGDGIPDKDDECPDDPGLKEFNGCPDRDGDGIPDKDDACPDEPGIKKFNGCPDRDGDGIPDKDDECPDVPGVAEFKGCPPPKITVTEKKIEFEGTVFFDFEQATIKPESFPLLNALAKTMKENPQIKKVRVDGHTDSVGRDDFNLNLSQRRAAAVVDYMIAQGVEAERLASEGFGKSKPIADNATEEGRAKNRRVELTILEMAKSGDKPKGKK